MAGAKYQALSFQSVFTYSSPDPTKGSGGLSQDDDFDEAESVESWLSWFCSLVITSMTFVFVLLTFPLSVWFCLKVVPQHERIVVFRLGRLRAPLGPGVALVLPCIDRWRRVDTRPRAFNVPPCRAMTRDGALVSVGADVRVRVHCPVLLLTAAQDVNRSSRSAAHTALASLLPRHSLHELQSESAKMADELALEVSKVTEPWGLEVERVELALEAVLCSPGATGLSAPLLPPCVPGLTPEAWGALAGPVQTILGGVMAMSDRQAAGRDAGCSLQAARSAVQEGGEGGDDGDDALLAAVGPLLCESLVERVGAVYRFDVQCRDGSCRTYHLDLKTGSGAVGRGPPPRGGPASRRGAGDDGARPGGRDERAAASAHRLHERSTPHQRRPGSRHAPRGGGQGGLPPLATLAACHPEPPGNTPSWAHPTQGHPHPGASPRLGHPHPGHSQLGPPPPGAMQ